MLLRCRSRLIDLSAPVVMGVLNVTPDSFSDGGLHHAADTAVAAGLRMVAEGASILDVGGESTRPGATPVPLEDELARVVPVIEALAQQTEAVLSVDTSAPEVMRAALRAGAHMVNDVRALRRPGALDAVVEHGAAVCLMHMQGEPATMQLEPRYDDVVLEVKGFLRDRINACRAAGVASEAILVDPGIGFGKTYEHNLALIRHLHEFTGLGAALLIGVSRKATVGKMTGRDVTDRLAGSIALAALCVERGARIVRAHDVAATVDAVKVAWSVIERSERA